jgi:hypothetical protein
MSSLNSIDEASSDTDSIAAKHDDEYEVDSSSSSSGASTSGDESDTDAQQAGELNDDITNVRATGGKPYFSITELKHSPLTSMLPQFLTQMEAANKELEAERAAGTLANRRIDEDENETKAVDGQYIEMNLGLGVFEEKTGNLSTSSESGSSSDSNGEGVMQTLLGGKRKRGMESEQSATAKKVKIEDVTDEIKAEAIKNEKIKAEDIKSENCETEDFKMEELKEMKIKVEEQ